MGYSNSAAFLVIALVLFSTANPLAHGQLFPSIVAPILTPIISPLLPGLSPPTNTPPTTRPPPITLPPITLPLPITLPPITLPPITLPPITLPPITLPPLLPVSPPISVGVPPPSTIPTNGTIVSGIICCTPTGTCPGTPVSGALVRVNCTSSVTGTSVLVGQNTTGANGAFNISIPIILGILPNALGQFPCVTSVQLPINQTVCTALSAVNGLLVGIVGPITTIVTQVLGLILSVTITGFILIG